MDKHFAFNSKAAAVGEGKIEIQNNATTLQTVQLRLSKLFWLIKI
jgi:hypothetical protein